MSLSVSVFHGWRQQSIGSLKYGLTEQMFCLTSLKQKQLILLRNLDLCYCVSVDFSRTFHLQCQLVIYHSMFLSFLSVTFFVSLCWFFVGIWEFLAKQNSVTLIDFLIGILRTLFVFRWINHTEIFVFCLCHTSLVRLFGIIDSTSIRLCQMAKLDQQTTITPTINLFIIQVQYLSLRCIV